MTFTGPHIGLARELLGQPSPGWPEVELEWAPPLADPPDLHFFHPDRALLRLVSGGHAVFDRDQRVARFHKAGPPNGHELAHPCLGSVAVVFGRWDGRVVFHAGAVVVEGLAWGVLGSKEAGKSTTLAWLARAGFDVLADDLFVLEGKNALAGPRTIDLRPLAAERLDGGEGLVLVRQGQRHRLVLPPVPASAPLGGFVKLCVDDEESVELVPLNERVEALRQHLTLRRAGLPASTFLELLAMPMWRLSRSTDWARLPRLLDRLVTTVSSWPRAASA